MRQQQIRVVDVDDDGVEGGRGPLAQLALDAVVQDVDEGRRRGPQGQADQDALGLGGRGADALGERLEALDGLDIDEATVAGAFFFLKKKIQIRISFAGSSCGRGRRTRRLVRCGCGGWRLGPLCNACRAWAVALLRLRPSEPLGEGMNGMRKVVCSSPMLFSLLVVVGKR